MSVILWLVQGIQSSERHPGEGRDPELSYHHKKQSEEHVTVRLACFRHAASVHPEPGSNSPKKRISS
jgi:hypothetical protein